MKKLFYNIILYFLMLPTVAAQSNIQTLKQQLDNPTLSTDSLVEVYHQLTKLYVQKKDYPAAIRATQSEIGLLKKKATTTKLGDAYYNLGSIHRGLTQYPNAQKSALKALSIYEKTLGKQHKEYASVEVFIAQTYFLQGKNKETLHWIEKALDTYQYLDTIPTTTVLKLKLLQSSILSKQYKLFAAQGILENSEQIYQQHKSTLSPDWLARIYNNIAFIKEKQLLRVEALAYYQKVVEIRTTLYHTQHTSLGSTYSNIGNCYHLINEEKKAIAYYRQSLQLLYSTPNISSLKIALSNYNIGHCYYKAHHLDTATVHIYKALDIYTLKLSSNSIEVADCYWLLAKIYQAKQQHTQAITFINKAISIKNNLLYTSHPSLFKLYLDKGLFLSKEKDYTSSWQYIHPTLIEIQSRLTYGSTLTYFKLLKLQVNNSLQLSTSVQKTTFEYLAPLKERVQQAIENTTLEGDERTLTDAVRSACENGLQLCYRLYQKTREQRYLLQAFDLMECNKAVSLNFNIQKNKQLETLPDSFQTQYYQLRSAIQAIEYQILDNNNHVVENLHPQLLEYKKSLEAFHKKHFFQEKENIFISVPLDSLQNRLIAQEEQIISYFYGEQFIYVFTIEKENCYLHQITPNFDSLYNLFFKHLTQLQPSKNNLKKAANTYEKVANHLTSKLLPPKLASRLYIIPDGKLNYVPFEALVEYQTGEATGFHALQYLIQKHEISYAGSCTAFYRQQYLHQNRPKSTVTAFAPTYNHTYGLAPLLHTQQEIDYLSKSFKGDFYTDEKATKLNFTQLKTTSGVVHLALHGQADNDISTLAKLFFSPSLEDSTAHVLAAHEIIACPVRADMITLSGCQTGIGTFRAGEGVISLARDFMKIGIPTVLTTLWQVNDQSSSQLIQKFYTQINQTNKAAALQQAKLDYLNNASAFQAHPYFWSGYVLMGNTKALDLEAKNNIFLWYLVPGLSLLFLIGLYFLIKTKK